MLQPSDGSVSKSGNSHLLRGMIAGLEPINFITLATPHLGVRGRKQVLFLFSYHTWNQKVSYIYLAVAVHRCSGCLVEKEVGLCSRVYSMYFLLAFGHIYHKFQRSCLALAGFWSPDCLYIINISWKFHLILSSKIPRVSCLFCWEFLF